MRLTGDFVQKNFFEKFRFFSLYFCFKCFRLREMGFFCCFQLGKNGFRDLCVSLRVFFGAVKYDEFLTMSFYTWFLRMILLIYFLQKFATFCASVCEARLRLCVKTLRFLSLRCGANFGRSRLVSIGVKFLFWKKVSLLIRPIFKKKLLNFSVAKSWWWGENRKEPETVNSIVSSYFENGELSASRIQGILRKKQ